MSAAETFRRMINDGLANAIYEAEQVARVDDQLGLAAERITALGFQEFFATIQRELLKSRILHIARLFDPPDERYVQFSLPAVLTYLQSNATEIPILERTTLARDLEASGCSIEPESPDFAVTLAAVAVFRSRIPDGGTDDTHPLAEALRRTRKLRHKVVAHPELVVRSTLPAPTYEEVDALLAVAKQFLAKVALAYFRIIDEDHKGKFLADAPARRAAFSLGRVLEALESAAATATD